MAHTRHTTVQQLVQQSFGTLQNLRLLGTQPLEHNIVILLTTQHITLSTFATLIHTKRECSAIARIEMKTIQIIGTVSSKSFFLFYSEAIRSNFLKIRIYSTYKPGLRNFAFSYNRNKSR